MSKIIYILHRSRPARDEHRLAQICARLVPDNIRQPVDHQICIQNDVAFAVVNYHASQAVMAEQACVRLGQLVEPHGAWEIPGTEPPDGCFALFRNSATCFEAVSDAAASRTIWYFHDSERFIAATSQRAILMYLGDYCFEKRVVPWMLSSGSLGPELAWDARLSRLPPDSSIVLNKDDWTLALKSRPIVFSQARRSRNEFKLRLGAAIARSVASLKAVAGGDWALTLSGGYDSRAILCLMKNAGFAMPALKTITWGSKTALSRPGNDAVVAQRLAGIFGAQHKLYCPADSSAALGRVLDRFILAGEGRIDHVAGYMDGMEMWRQLAEDDGIRTLIRGDEGFGWATVSSEALVRHKLGCALCSDFRNLQHVVQRFHLGRQELPDWMKRAKGETLATWRDRLYHAFRLPSVLAALSDIKAFYVETINPFLARSVLEEVRAMPDDCRTEKELFREIALELSPDVPYATEMAIAMTDDVVARNDVVDLLKSTLQGPRARAVFPQDFLDFILGDLVSPPAGVSVPTAAVAPRRTLSALRNSFEVGLKRMVPRHVINWMRRRILKPKLNGNLLAFRTYLIVRMHEIFELDGQALK